MSLYKINTQVIKDKLTELETYKNYYEGKISSFEPSKYNSTGYLTDYLKRIQGIYRDIAANIDTLKKYIEEYITDIESLESVMATHRGYVQAEGIYAELMKYVNLLENKNSYDSYGVFEVSAMASSSAVFNNQYKFADYSLEEIESITDYVDEATYSYRMYGYTDEDIRRLLTNEITISDLYTEIQYDTDRTRMQKMVESLYLVNYTQGFKSEKEADDAIAKLKEQQKQLIEHPENFIMNYDDLKDFEKLKKIGELSDVLSAQRDAYNMAKELGIYGITSLEDLINKDREAQEKLVSILDNQELFDYYEAKNLHTIIEKIDFTASYNYHPKFEDFKNEIVAVKAKDRFGHEYYIFPEVYADGTSEVYLYKSNEYVTYEYMTLEQMYGGTELYEEFKASLVTEKDRDGNDILVWTKDQNNINGYPFKYKLEGIIDNETSKRKIDDINSRIKKLSNEIYNYEFVETCVKEDTAHYMNFIDVVAKNKDFAECNQFNEEVLNNIKDLDTISTNEQKINLIYGIINKEIDVSKGTAGTITIDGKSVSVKDADLIIDYAEKWAKFLDEDETKVFNYYVNKKEYDKAYEFLQNMSRPLDERWVFNEKAKDAEWAQENWFNSVVASAGSVVLTPVEGIDAFFTSIGAEITGDELYQSDVYSHGLIWREAVSSKINTEFGSTAAFLYNTGMSMVDSTLLVGLNACTGGSASFALTVLLSGSRSYVAAINDTLGRGVTSDKAILLSLASATVEILMEYKSLGHLTNLEGKLGTVTASLPEKVANLLGGLDCADQLVKATYIIGCAVSQGICESEEEFATEIANYLIEYFILQEDSTFIKSLNEKGLEATLKDLGEDAALAALGGFISGGVFGGIHGATTVTQTSFALSNNMYNNLQGDTRARQLASAFNINQQESQLFQDALNKMKNQENLTSDEANILLNKTTLMQAGAQMKKNISSAFANFGQKIQNNTVELFNKIFNAGRNAINQIEASTGAEVAANTSTIDATYDIPDNIASSVDPINGVTAELIPINSLYDILNSDEAYNNFLNMESGQKAKYANAIFELMSLANKTDLGLSNAAIERGNLIVTGYSNLSSTIDNMKSNPYIQMIASGNGDNVDYNAIFGSDIYKMRNFVTSYEELINLPGNEVLLNFKNNIDEFIKNSIKQVVSNKIVLSSDSYGRFCSYLLYGDSYIDVPTIEYFNYMKSLGYKAEGTIQKVMDNYDYYNNEMVQELKDFFGRRFSIKELRQELNKAVRYIPKSLFDTLYPGKNWMGCNNGEISTINLGNENEMNDVITHESIHHLSADGSVITKLPKKIKNFIQNLPGYIENAYFSVSGLTINSYNPNDKSSKKFFGGLNEAVTEYFTKQIHPKSKSGYDYSVSELDLLVKSGIFSVDMLKNAYLNNDITLLAQHFKKILHLNDNSLFVSLMNTFDEVNFSKDIDIKNKAQTTLHKLITAITYSYANKTKVNLTGIELNDASNVNISETSQGMQFDSATYYDGQSINVTSDLDGQTYTIQLSFLTNILRDDYTYQTFLQSDDATKALYIKGLYQLINTSLGFELGLSAEELQFGRDIINWFEQNQYSSIQNEYNLKQYLLNKVSNITDPAAKARALYMELNKLVHYDANFIAGSKDAKQQIYDAQDNVSLDSLEVNQRVVCKGWANLYYDLLIEAGFDSANVKLLVSDSNYSLAHKWVEIDLGDGIIIADATDAINKSIDLVSAKAGLATNGFLYLDSSWSGTMIRTAIANHQLTDEILESNKQYLLQLDQYLGYANENGYFDEQLKVSKELFGGSKLFQKIIKGLSPQTIIDRVLHLEVPSNLDGYEAFAYYKRILTNLFGDSIKFGYGTKYWQNGTSIEPIFVLDYQINGSSYIYVYSESLGQLYFNDYKSYFDYIRNLDLTK